MNLEMGFCLWHVIWRVSRGGWHDVAKGFIYFCFCLRGFHLGLCVLVASVAMHGCVLVVMFLCGVHLCVHGLYGGGVGALGSDTLTLAPATLTAGAVSILTVTINQLTNALVQGDYIQFTLPTTTQGWALSSGSATSCTVDQGGAKDVTSTDISSLTVQVLIGVSGVAASSTAVVLSCSNVKNPTIVTSQATSVNLFTTYQGKNLKIDESSAGVLSAITTGRIWLGRGVLGLVCCVVFICVG